MTRTEREAITWTTPMDARPIQFCDCVSKVTITDQFTEEYMEVLLRYPIGAQLIDKRTA